MLRTNLSTRPFYNERRVHVAAAVAAVAVIGFAMEAIKKIASSDCAWPKPRRTAVVPLFTANVAAVNLPASTCAWIKSAASSSEVRTGSGSGGLEQPTAAIKAE